MSATWARRPKRERNRLAFHLEALTGSGLWKERQGELPLETSIEPSNYSRCAAIRKASAVR
jgi:hypothetical protein